MADIDWPISPSPGDVWSQNGKTWVWTGYAWDAYGGAAQGPSGPTGPIGATGPTGPTAEKKIDSFYGYDMSTDVTGFVWNSASMTAGSTIAWINQRWKIQEFSGTAPAIQGCTVNTCLPSYYLAGTSIKITLVSAAVTTNTTGNIKYFVGLAKPTAGNVLGTDADTEWQSFVYAAAGNTITVTSLTFLGTNLSAGEPISVLVYRNSNDAQDTSTGLSIISSISIEIA